MLFVVTVFLVPAVIAGMAAMFWTWGNRKLPPREPGRLFVGNVDFKPEVSYFL
jgi:hypothetical protein